MIARLNIILLLIIIFLLLICFHRNAETFDNNKNKNIKDFLLKFKGKKIIFIPNPGNGGDALIASGTFKVFDDIGIDYEIGNGKKKYDNSVLMWGGGGNFVELYSNCRDFIKNNLDRNNTIIVLPHTVKKNEDLLKKLDKNVFICAREKRSYDHLKKNVKYPENIYLFDDMAFNLTNMKDDLFYQVDKNKYEVGNFYRTDKESKYNRNIKDNVDLSLKYLYDSSMRNKEKVNKNTLDIFKEVNKYKVINTDRLHIAVAGTLLNKKTNMYQNNYYKNKAVYEQSIKNKYNNTILHD